MTTPDRGAVPGLGYLPSVGRSEASLEAERLLGVFMIERHVPRPPRPPLSLVAFHGCSVHPHPCWAWSGGRGLFFNPKRCHSLSIPPRFASRNFLIFFLMKEESGKDTSELFYAWHLLNARVPDGGFAP